MHHTNSMPIGMRGLILAVACATFGALAACGKFKPKQQELGPRIASMYISGTGNHGGLVGSMYNTQLTVNIVDFINNSDQLMSFTIQNVSQTPSSSAETRDLYLNNERTAFNRYSVQAMCIDLDCMQLGFLVVVESYSSPAGVIPMGGSNYGTGTSQYVSARYSVLYQLGRAYTGTTNSNVQELRPKQQGNWLNITDAMRAVGVPTRY